MTLLKKIFFLHLLLMSNLQASILLPITSDKVIAFSVLPNKEHGASAYTLKIYDNDKAKIPLITVTHPLSGRITDVDITDIDQDKKDELVVSSAHQISAANKHQDIYEFVEKGMMGRIQALFVKLFNPNISH